MCQLSFYLQELHEPPLHVEHPADVPFSTPFRPKRESFFVTWWEPQFGQSTALIPNTSFSKSRLQAEHLYSKIGMDVLLINIRWQCTCVIGILFIDFSIPYGVNLLELLREMLYGSKQELRARHTAMTADMTQW